MNKVLIFFCACIIMLGGKVCAGEITIAGMPPSVVKTVPQCGEIAVDPGLTEIRVTFSKDMLTEKMWSFIELSHKHFPKVNKVKPIHFLKDKRTCILPVKLEPNKTYAIWINMGKFNNFRDTNNKPAVPYLLVFKTTDKK